MDMVIVWLHFSPCTFANHRCF